MKKILIVLLLTCSIKCFAQVETDFEQYKREQEEMMDSIKNSDSIAISQMGKEYDEYVKAEKEAYDNFKKRMGSLWGDDNVIESTKKDWVEYSDEGKTRSKVDFEEGKATIEIIIEPEEEKSEILLNKKVEQKIKELILNKGKTKDYDSSKEKALPLQETPVLENQIQTPSGKILTENTLNKDVKEIIREIDIEIKKIKGNNGQKHEVVVVKLDLVPDHIKIRAEKYKKEIEKYCLKYDVSPAMVYAVMQTESSFNPKAKSYVPAYGLMQIVPASAGKDCAKSLKKGFLKPTANYLYEPENNIEMGIYYLYLLRRRHYTQVTDVNSQNLCMIASYNTGAGNVARALRGDTNIFKAIPKINDMSYEQLFKYFEKNLLPETQDYIKKVTERMNNFEEWIK